MAQNETLSKSGETAEPKPELQLIEGGGARPSGRGWMFVIIASALIVAGGTWFFLSRKEQKAPATLTKLELLNPTAKKQFWIAAADGVVFEWTTPSDGTGEDESLQIATDRKFTKIIKQLDHVKSPFTVKDLKRDSTYFWRVVLPTGAQTDAREFFVGEKSPPVLLAPASGTKTPLRHALLAWQNKARVESYRVQISLKPNFSESNVVRDFVVGGDRYQASELPPGRYYWRVSVRDRKLLRGLWSEGRAITITYDRRPAYYSSDDNE